MLGCSVRWHLVSQPDGLWLMKPWRPNEWSGPGPRLSVVRMTQPAMARIRSALTHYWEGRRLNLCATDADKVLALVDACIGLAHRGVVIPHSMIAELEWAADTLRVRAST